MNAPRQLLAPALALAELRAERSRTDLVLQWSPVWTNAVLQRTTGLGSSAWEPVPGVTNNAARLPATSPQGFFRLQTP